MDFSTLVVGAVKQAQAQVPDASVLATGHSLGAAISLLDAIFLKQQLPSNTSIEVVGFGRPRVGNAAFANWVDSMFGANNTFVVSRDDPVPHVPLLAQGFQHASGEVWIKDNTTILACDGQENPSVSDHTGPYFGVNMGHASCANPAIATVVSGTKTLTTTAAEVTTPFSTSLSLRVTSTPSNILIDTKNGVRGGIEMHTGAAMGAVVFSALVGAVVLF
ncbi:Alpha/Beta hydrolase protein [Mycena metata]|uniref:Alpha/Beta hydrolase protein n=1 Tax=Mycena metata TaxID=1033252 RepID=A0AAD7DK88_9AGAR|nr:Alpha/Beta hydrolase protein [Mycena metata]